MRTFTLAFVALFLAGCSPESESESPANEQTGKPARYLTASIRSDYPGFVGQETALAASTARMEREYKEADERARREHYERWSAGMIEADLADENFWRATPITRCREFGSGSAPQLCLQIEGANERKFGNPIGYHVRWRNLPDDAYIRVWVVNAAPAERRSWYLGPRGSISLAPLGMTAEGNERVVWDGRSITCAPADAPMLCDMGQVGTYVLRAAIVTGADPFHVGWPSRLPVGPTRYHARSQAQPIRLTGQPHRLHAVQPIAEAIERALPTGVRGRRYSLDKFGPWFASGRSYCSRLNLEPPLAGSIKTCFPRSRRDEFGIGLRPGDAAVSGDARLATGIMSQDEAVTRAIAYGIGMTGKRATYPAYPSETDMVRSLYPNPRAYDGAYGQLRRNARDAGLTFVDVNQPYPTFRDEEDRSWWLVGFSLWITTIDGPTVEDFGRVWLRVDHDGNVCRVDPAGAEGQWPDRRELYSGCRPGSRKRIDL
jgi:hypothetical protein